MLGRTTTTTTMKIIYTKYFSNTRLYSEIKSPGIFEISVNVNKLYDGTWNDVNINWSCMGDRPFSNIKEMQLVMKKAEEIGNEMTKAIKNGNADNFPEKPLTEKTELSD